MAAVGKKNSVGACDLRTAFCSLKAASLTTGIEGLSPRAAPQQEMRPLSSEEARRLLEAARVDRLEALYVLAITTGMRRGELLGLTWSDVDLKNSTVSIRRTLTRIDNGERITDWLPKLGLAPQKREVPRNLLNWLLNRGAQIRLVRERHIRRVIKSAKKSTTKKG
jgi:integrase